MSNSGIIENTKRIIQQKGLKQKVVAERAGFSYQQFSSLLNHRRTIKDTDVAAIADALEVTPNELFGICQDRK